MRYALTTKTPPNADPVNLDRVKAHLRIDHAEEDELLKGWVTAAREMCEAHTGRLFGSRTMRMVLHGFPGAADCIELPVEPVSAVTLFTYYDTQGVLQTMTAVTDYQTFLEHSPPLVAPPPLLIWPYTEAGRLNPVTLEFTAGAGEVPETFKAALLLTLGFWDQERSGGDLADVNTLGLPPGALSLLRLLKTGNYS